MGTGKTAVGRRLASQLRMRYVDTDDVIEQDNQRYISDIFAEDGEAVFRRLESEAVRKVSKRHNYVISTGGGVVLKAVNMEKPEAERCRLLLNGDSRGNLSAHRTPKASAPVTDTGCDGEDSDNVGGNGILIMRKPTIR